QDGERGRASEDGVLGADGGPDREVHGEALVRADPEERARRVREDAEADPAVDLGVYFQPPRPGVTERKGADGRPSAFLRTICCVSDAVRELIEAYDEAWNRQDLDALCAFHTDDVVFENHTAGERVEGAEAVRDHIGGIFERWPTL